MFLADYGHKRCGSVTIVYMKGGLVTSTFQIVSAVVVERDR